MYIQPWETLLKNLPKEPRHRDFVITYYYKTGNLIAKKEHHGNLVIIEEKVKDLPSKVEDWESWLNIHCGATEHSVDVEAYEKALEAVVAGRCLFIRNFKLAVFADLDIPLDHPKADVLWSMACENVFTGDNVAVLYEEVKKLSLLLVM
jgi:hypothetical protein